MALFSELESICKGRLIQLANDGAITDLIIDSRQTIGSVGSVFFAIGGERHDGHQFIASLYAKGIRHFIIEKDIDRKKFREGNFLLVSSSLHSLQLLAAHHRTQFAIPIFGITGSNGKTIIKEWLYQLLSKDYNIVKNPGSYNSQLGVPLSVWQIQKQHQLGLFEAGISKTGEMERLKEIIQPTIGIFTNIGTAHDEGFENVNQKIREKVKLFEKAGVIIFCQDHAEVLKVIKKEFSKEKLLSWGYTEEASIRLKRINGQEVEVLWKGKSLPIHFPFSDFASQENASHCIVAMLHLGIAPKVIQERILQLKGVPMRLELKQGINGCQIIDDTYNNDLGGLQICLNFLNGIQKKKKVVILSDIHQSGLEEKVLVSQIAEMLGRSGIQSFIGIGPILSKHQNILTEAIEAVKLYPTTDAFLNEETDRFQNEVILIKGARVFQFPWHCHGNRFGSHGSQSEFFQKPAEAQC
jgi:alanine racemase